MTEKILFSVIGALMFTIAGVGVTAAAQHPDEVVALVPEAVQTVERAISNATGTIVHVVASAFATTDTAIEGPSASEQMERSEAESVGNSTSNAPLAWGDDDEDEEDGSEEEEDDDGDDSRRVASKSQASAPTSASPKISSSPAPSTKTSVPVSAQSLGVRTFTMHEVSAHASAANCYSAINGSVYDLTSFINQHPGGSAAIRSLCGVDGSAAFNGQHGGQGRPANELASLKIGILAQ